MIKCAFCGYDFRPEEAESSCRSCPMAGDGCRLVRCPRCGYESLPEAKLVIWGRGLMERWRRYRKARAEGAGRMERNENASQGVAT